MKDILYLGAYHDTTHNILLIAATHQAFMEKHRKLTFSIETAIHDYQKEKGTPTNRTTSFLKVLANCTKHLNRTQDDVEFTQRILHDFLKEQVLPEIIPEASFAAVLVISECNLGFPAQENCPAYLHSRDDEFKAFLNEAAVRTKHAHRLLITATEEAWKKSTDLLAKLGCVNAQSVLKDSGLAKAVKQAYHRTLEDLPKKEKSLSRQSFYDEMTQKIPYQPESQLLSEGKKRKSLSEEQPLAQTATQKPVHQIHAQPSAKISSFLKALCCLSIDSVVAPGMIDPSDFNLPDDSEKTRPQCEKL